MIATEQEYKLALETLKDLKSQYQSLPHRALNRPYAGQQMAREIFKLTSDLKQYEYNRFEVTTQLTKD